MKHILEPIFKYTLSTIVALYVLIITLCFYPIIVIWEFKLMSWNEYMVYNYINGVNYTDDRTIKMLEEESFFHTIKRWVNFKYAIIYEETDFG